MIWQTLSVNKVVEKTATDKLYGLSEAEAQRRLETNGKNEISRQKKDSIFKKFVGQFNDYMILILIAAAIISFIIAVYEGKNDFVEPIVIVSIIFINAIIGVIQEEKAEKALAALQSMTQPTATVIRDGTTKKINSSELVCGDIIALKSGDLVPADARIINCNNLYTDEASLTGESNPVRKNSDSTYPEDTPVADMLNMIWSSTAVTSGNCTAVVTETGESTQVGKIAKAIIESETPQTPLQQKLESTGKILGTTALIICVIVFVAGVVKETPPMEMFMTAVSLAVAAIPEGLPAIVTIMLAIGVQKMAKKNSVVKKLPAVETLGSASVICSDKTGTLTQNKMTVTNIYGNIGQVISTAAICCNGTDSTEKAILNYAENEHIFVPKRKRVKEIPFSSATKYMATISEIDSGYLIAVKGAPDILLNKCRLAPEEESKIISAHKEMTGNALRVLAVAYAETNSIPSDIDLPLNFSGLIGISDPPRPEIYEAVKSCKNAGIKPIMITGDHAETAAAIAKEIGINPTVITGPELNRVTDIELRRNIKKYSVFARVTPEHKVRIVRALQANGEVAAMTGDGVNDAPALKQADIGCAMGINGTDVAKEAADMILTDDNFATIVEAVHEGRCIFANIKKAVHFLLSSNIGEILTIFCAIILGLPSPLTAVQLLWVNLITDSLPAIALGVDTNSKKEIMSQKPIKRNQSLFANGHGLTIFLEGILIGTLSLIAFCLGYFRTGNCETGRTMAFCVLSMSQLVHSYNVRTENSVFSHSSPTNKVLHLAFVLGIILQICVVTLPVLSGWFGTVMLNADQWKIVATLTVIPLIAVELSKFIHKIHN